MSIRLLLSVNTNKENYIYAVNKSGADAEARYLSSLDTDFDGLILCGGADIHPSYYGEAINGSVDIDDALDTAEIALARAYIGMGKPILGICRGHQLLNVLFGGTLCQHIPNAERHTPGKNGDAVHDVITEPGSFVSRLYGERITVNSHHHQAIKAVGEGLRAAAMSDDGTVIEAIEHRELPIIGVQWHPERICNDKCPAGMNDGRLIFEHFIGICKKCKH